MRHLSETFMHALQKGFLSPLMQAVNADRDLDLYIRENYINIYFKGSALLKLSERNPQQYKVEIHPKYLEGLQVADLNDAAAVADFVSNIPALKANIIAAGRTALEIEYEQLIVRANNNEPRNNSELFIVDRQYAMGRERIDLMGFQWIAKGRRKGQAVEPCIIEVKFGLNPDIRGIAGQLRRYYEGVKKNPAGIAAELETVFRQRLDLGLYDQSAPRVKAMRTLHFAREMDQFLFILILVDYNPHSSLFEPAALEELPFASQVRVFRGGFAMWHHRLEAAAG
jgi:hypothetical protein